ncbi:MAG TPA: heparinase II/III family protein [Hyphomicrobiales bacterium]|nr:heparinase II/III family protein [Hyphomicrobiales bacterium]
MASTVTAVTDRAAGLVRLVPPALHMTLARTLPRVASRALPALSAPERLLVAPPVIEPGDPARGAELYAGRFALARLLVDADGRSIFEVPPPSADWAAALAGFAWLGDLAAAGTSLAQVHARALVTDWLSRRPPRIGRRPEVAARRLIAWLAWSRFLLEGADTRFVRRFLRAVATESRTLRATAWRASAGLPRLTVAVALAEAALAMAVPPGQLRRRLALLTAELERQILPDGGHISRNPAALIELLLLLLPLREACVARQVEPPAVLLGALDRMLPMLRFFRHGDGAFALFNGMGTTQPALVEAILGFDDAAGRPVLNAPHSGYQRLESRSGLVVIADTGAPLPTAVSAAAHAGALSFELSLGRERVVVNCGASLRGDDAWRSAARSTAAHSTLGLDAVSSCRFLGGRLARLAGPLVLAGPSAIKVTREDGPAATTVRAAHDGYAARFGALHERTLVASGDALDGFDRLVPAPGRTLADEEATLRFHLHPDVAARLGDDSRIVLIRTPGGRSLAFAAEGHPLALDESIHLADPMGPRRSSQIVLRVRSGQASRLAWRFALAEP